MFPPFFDFWGTAWPRSSSSRNDCRSASFGFGVFSFAAYGLPLWCGQAPPENVSNGHWQDGGAPAIDDQNVTQILAERFKGWHAALIMTINSSRTGLSIEVIATCIVAEVVEVWQSRGRSKFIKQFLHNGIRIWEPRLNPGERRELRGCVEKLIAARPLLQKLLVSPDADAA